MKNIIQKNLLIIAFMLLAGCHSQIHVKHSVNKAGKITFYFESDSFFSKRQRISYIYVKDIKEDKVVWGVLLRKQNAKYIEKIEYGDKPQDYEFVTNTENLIFGREYKIKVSGPGASGSLTFLYDY